MKLLAFPRVAQADIPERLRLLASEIEEGEYGAVTNIIGIIETEDTVQTFAFGGQWDAIRIAGLMHLAINRLFGCVE